MSPDSSQWLDVVLLELYRRGVVCLAEVQRMRSTPDPEGVHALALLLSASCMAPREEAYAVPAATSPAALAIGWPTSGGFDSVHRSHAVAPYARQAADVRTN